MKSLRPDAEVVVMLVHDDGARVSCGLVYCRVGTTLKRI